MEQSENHVFRSASLNKGTSKKLPFRQFLETAELPDAGALVIFNTPGYISSSFGQRPTADSNKGGVAVGR
jgi:hypothetical protein